MIWKYTQLTFFANSNGVLQLFSLLPLQNGSWTYFWNIKLNYNFYVNQNLLKQDTYILIGLIFFASYNGVCNYFSLLPLQNMKPIKMQVTLHETFSIVLNWNFSFQILLEVSVLKIFSCRVGLQLLLLLPFLEFRRKALA